MGCSFEFAVGKSCGVDWDDGLGQAEGRCNEKSGDADGMGWNKEQGKPNHEHWKVLLRGRYT